MHRPWNRQSYLANCASWRQSNYGINITPELHLVRFRNDQSIEIQYRDPIFLMVHCIRVVKILPNLLCVMILSIWGLMRGKVSGERNCSIETNRIRGFCRTRQPKMETKSRNLYVINLRLQCKTLFLSFRKFQFCWFLWLFREPFGHSLEPIRKPSGSQLKFVNL